MVFSLNKYLHFNEAYYLMMVDVAILFPRYFDGYDACKKQVNVSRLKDASRHRVWHSISKENVLYHAREIDTYLVITARAEYYYLKLIILFFQDL